jgi:propanol-preferring alcohol dehydrogenase
MRAMTLRQVGAKLMMQERPTPKPGRGEVLIRTAACGVCRTDLHVVDGELPAVPLPIVPGHEIVGRIEAIGADVEDFGIGERVGVPWLASTCGVCRACRSGRENLCDQPSFTGYNRDGGFASHTLADSRYCLRLPETFDDLAAAPLLCAGLISYRCLIKAGDPARLGLYGFGAAAHILAQVARCQGREVFAFTRPGDLAAQRFARALGCVWAGGSDEPSPEPLDAAIIFAPHGELVPAALANVVKGGRVVCGGIHMSDIPAFAYRLLWQEREIVSVANLTREDARAFLALAPRVGLNLSTKPYRLEAANEALDDLRMGRFQGAAVLVP